MLESVSGTPTGDTQGKWRYCGDQGRRSQIKQVSLIYSAAVTMGYQMIYRSCVEKRYSSSGSCYALPHLQLCACSFSSQNYYSYLNKIILKNLFNILLFICQITNIISPHLWDWTSIHFEETCHICGFVNHLILKTIVWFSGIWNLYWKLSLGLSYLKFEVNLRGLNAGKIEIS